MQESLPIDIHKLKDAALHYRAVNNKYRLQILEFIHKKGRAEVRTIYQVLELEQSVVSMHLAVLRKADLVVAERKIKSKIYSINYTRLKLLHDVADMLQVAKEVVRPEKKIHA